MWRRPGREMIIREHGDWQVRVRVREFVFWVYAVGALGLLAIAALSV